MPVSFQPAKHPAKNFPLSSDGLSATEILQNAACAGQYKRCHAEIFQSSLDLNVSHDNMIPRRNGFVNTVVDCYSQHRALIIRPDDVWLAILTQFNFFVNGNAEQLRKQFVSHEGKRELTVTMTGTRYSVDFGVMARTMTDLMEQHIIDPNLREWILPNFTTTTITDTTVSCMVMMATMKAYFSYKFCLCCGIPRVTLEGEKEDWEIILAKLEKLKQYGKETIAWFQLLQPIISRFVGAFDSPDADDNLDFWQKVAHYEGGGSGPRWLSGWINAFCVFDEKGKWLGHPIGTKNPNPPRGASLTLDGVNYHRIDSSDIPAGFAEVDVKLDDNGQLFDTVLTAGLMCTQVCDSGDQTLSSDGRRDTGRPLAAWWIFAKKDE